MAYVPLHVHTEHSALDGMARLKTLFQHCSDIGLKACATTDHGSLNGLWKSSQEAQTAGIKFIPGMEAYMAIGSRHEKNETVVDRDGDEGMGDAEDGTGDKKAKKFSHLTILAKNRTGWHNLIRFHNESQLSYWHKPRGDYELLKQYGEGLIVLSGCLAGPVAGPLSRAARAERQGDDAQAKRMRAEARAGLDALIDAVGEDNVFLEIMDHGIGAEADALEEIYELHHETGIPLVVTNDSHYQDADEEHIHDGFLCVGTGSKIDQPGRFAFNGSGYYMKSEQQMLDIHPDDELWVEAVHNSGRIADMVQDDTVPPAQMRLPEFPIPEGYDSQEQYLRELVQEGLVWRYGEEKAASDEVQSRAETELGVITRMGFPSYFLIMHDLLDWCRSDAPIHFDDPDAPKKEPIIVGLGRGSAAGSLVSYALDIVGVCPLENGLLFERFLEEGREGLPDIDTDFPATRRDEVFSYLIYRWGAENCARIGQYGVAKTKAAIKDAARILKPFIPEGADAREARSRGAEFAKVGDRLAALVPQEGEKPFTFAMLDSDDRRADAFWDYYEENEEYADPILELARGFEGVAKSPGIHPCGFIISPDPLFDIVPLRRASNKADADPDAPMVIGWDGVDCDGFGLLKLDILGLMNLDIVQEALKNIELNTDESIDFASIPKPHEGTEDVMDAWHLFDAGSTGGIFQCESDGMTRMIQSFVPRSLADISVAVAAYRPGPMAAGVPDLYAKRKHGRSEVDYGSLTDDPEEQKWIGKVLGETQGLLVYQEQAMQLGSVLAGFDAGQRSLLRRAIGKKKEDAMRQVGDLLAAGAGKEFHDESGNLISPIFAPETVEQVFKMMKGAAAYAFNKSHSVAYGYLAYITAYLKARWPVEYGAAILAVAEKDDKRAAALKSLTSDGIEVLPPNINASRAQTSPVGESVLLGLGEIKDVGHGVAQAIAAERDANGEFSSLHDLLSRVKVKAKDGRLQSIVSSAIVGLIEAGALDAFGPRMGLMMIARASKSHELSVPPLDWDPAYRSARERFRLGINLGSNALDDLAEVLDEWSETTDAQLRADQEDQIEDRWGRRQRNPESLRPTRLSEALRGQRWAKAFAVVSGWHERSSRSGRMAHAVLADGFEQIDAVIFHHDFVAMSKDYSPQIGDVVCVTGEIRIKEIPAPEDEEGAEPRFVQEMFISSVRRVHTPVATPIPASLDQVQEQDEPKLETEPEVTEPDPEPEVDETVEPTVLLSSQLNPPLIAARLLSGPGVQGCIDLPGSRIITDLTLIRHHRKRYIVIFDKKSRYSPDAHAERGDRAVQDWGDTSRWATIQAKVGNNPTDTDFDLYLESSQDEHEPETTEVIEPETTPQTEEVESAVIQEPAPEPEVEPIEEVDEPGRPLWRMIFDPNVDPEKQDPWNLPDDVAAQAPEDYAPDLDLFSDWGQGDILYISDGVGDTVIGVFSPDDADLVDELRLAVENIDDEGWTFSDDDSQVQRGIWIGLDH